MKKPNFLVAGFPKCGTTSLYEYLKIHPQVYLPEIKELNYFSNRFLQKATNGPDDKRIFVNGGIITQDDYFAQYLNVKDEIAIGDCSPSYTSYPECIPHIINVLGPFIKIIIIVRNPIDRAYSNYRHLKRQGRESLNFIEAVLAEEVRLKQGYSDFWGYKSNSLYHDKIKKFKNEFSNVKIITFEELVRDNNMFIDILEFLEIKKDYDLDYLNNRFNEGINYKSNLIVNTLTTEGDLKRFVINKFPKWTHKSLLKVKRRILDKNRATQDKLSDQERIFMKDFFAKDVKKLERDFKLNISYWKDFT